MMQERLRSFRGSGEEAPRGGATTAARLHGIYPNAGRGVGLSSVPSPNTALPSNDLEETWEMNNTVELKCWACEKPFNIEYGPGRPPRYCGPSCKNLARKIARRVRFVERIEQRRAACAEVPSVENNSAS